jgi:plastocyanin
MPRIRRSRLALPAVGVAGVLLAGCGGDDRSQAAGSAGAARAAAQVVTVSIEDFKYAPPTITVPAGTTIRFENGDTQAHTATAKEKAFDSDRIEPGMAVEVTAGAAGSIAYFCAYHPFMQGVIEVQ